jgi:hypothetical protein
MFTNTQPYRLKVSGRIKHYTSAFGEHVIGEEVEKAMIKACGITGAEVIEFTVAPQIDGGENSLPYHEWFVEFGKEPEDKAAFAKIEDERGILQVYFTRDAIGEDWFKEVKKLIEVGDIISVTGFPFVTKTGELSLHVKKLELATKSITPLPEKFHGKIIPCNKHFI